MSYARWLAACFTGMGTQAAISAALFPAGIDPAQQMAAALVSVLVAVLLVIVDAVERRGSRE